MNKVNFAALARALLGILAFASYGQPDKTIDEKEMLLQLKRDRAATAKDLFDVTTRDYEAGSITFDLLVAASEKLRDAELASATKQDEKLKVLRSNLERTKAILAKVKERADLGLPGGQKLIVLQSELANQDAEIALLSAMSDRNG